MHRVRIIVQLTTLCVALISAVSCATVSEEDFLALTQERDVLSSQVETLARDLEQANGQVEAMESKTSDLQDIVEAQNLELTERAAELTAIDAEMASIVAENNDLTAQVARLNNALETASLRAENAETAARASANVAAAQTARADEVADAIETAESIEKYREALFAGTEGFEPVASFGYAADPQASSRQMIAPGVAMDSTGTQTVLFDTRLEYDRTSVYLTILAPESRSPRLILTAQFGTDQEPLWSHTAFIAIEGSDPVDPIDPIVLNETPVRETDGATLIERFSVEVDSSLFRGLSSMLSSRKFAATFVGSNGDYTHRPSVGERAALSNILFAFIDLGGMR